MSKLNEPFHQNTSTWDETPVGGPMHSHDPVTWQPIRQQPVLGRVAPQPSASCTMTAEMLEQHLQQSNYGENKARYLCYFHEGMPPRCVTCGQPIGAHPRGQRNHGDGNTVDMFSANTGGFFTVIHESPQQPVTHSPSPPPRQRPPHPQSTQRPLPPTAAPPMNQEEWSAMEDLRIQREVEEELLDMQMQDPSSRTVDASGNVKQHLGGTLPTCFLCRDRFQMTDRAIPAGFLFEMQEYGGVQRFGNHDLMYGVSDGCCDWEMKPEMYPVSCDECGIVAQCAHEKMSSQEKEVVKDFWRKHRTLKFYKCELNTFKSGYRKGGGKRSKGAPLRFYCNRLVCSYCVAKGRNTRAGSRFHHNEPEWRTALLGCCASPHIVANTMMCYYCCEHRSSMMEGNLDQFSHHSLQNHLKELGRQTGMAALCFPFYLLFLVLLLPADILGITIQRMKYHEVEIRTRFGVAEHSCVEWIFCRHCIYMRLLREAEARGYPQPMFWTAYDSMYDIIPKYPPHPSLAKAPTAQAIF